MLWAVFTLIAAAAQTARNAMQRELTATLGTVGATHVRFLFGFPFALIFLPGVMLVTGYGLPHPPLEYWPWIVAGALTQIAATATMLSAMNERSFVVAYAYIKTEPVQVALFGLIFLGDKVTPLAAAAVLIATAGVIVISLKSGAAQASTARSTIVGLLSGALVRAVGDRLSRRHPGAAFAAFRHGGDVHAGGRPGDAGGAAVGLSGAARSQGAAQAIARAWKPSLFAGFMGALASEFWFLGFAIATAANVRTLALVEVLFAQGVTHFIFKQPTTRARSCRHRAGGCSASRSWCGRIKAAAG